MKLASLIIALLLGAVSYFCWHNYVVVPRRNMRIMSTRTDLSLLKTEISMVLDGENFRPAVGTGIVTDATSLTTLNPSLKHHLTDWRFGRVRPYHVRLSQRGPIGTNADGLIVYFYDLALWSDGPNGINEAGKGDDVCVSNVVECIAEPDWPLIIQPPAGQ